MFLMDMINGRLQMNISHNNLEAFAKASLLGIPLYD